MICKYCNSEIPENSKFCKYCGSILEPNANFNYAQPVAPTPVTPVAPVAPVVAEPAAAPAKPKKKKSKLKKALLSLLITLLVLSIIGTVLIFVFFPPNRFYIAETKVTTYFSDTENEIVYEFSADGFPVRMSFNNETSMEFKLDDKGRIEKIVGEDESVKIKYKKDSGETTGKSEEIDGGYAEVSYNKFNKITSLKIYADDKEQTSIIWEYNIFGKVTYMETNNLTSKTIRKFDYKGDVVIQESYQDDVLVSSYEYGKNSKPVSSSVGVSSTEDGKTYVTQYTNSEFNENGILIKAETFDSDNKRISYKEIESEDDDEITLAVHDADGKVTGYTVYELDEDGYATKEKSLNTDKELISYVTYIYDKYGNILTQKGYDADGELLTETENTWKNIPIFG